jgi:hypothetical protein
MLTVEQIIGKAKRSTNTSQLDSISTLLCQDYLNRIQSYIEDQLFLVNDENDLFIKDYTFNLVPGQDAYDLPVDIYAKSSIDTVAVSFLNGLSNTYLPLKKVSRKQRGFTFGYFVQETSIVFTPRPTSTLSMKLSYQRKLPTLSVVCGTVASLLGNTLTLNGYVANFTDECSYISVSSTVNNRLIVSHVEGTSITLNDVTGINVGDAILIGEYAANVSQLPKECEKYLISALERLIQYRQSSADFNTSNLLTSEELNTIKEVFADNSYDDAKPPVTEWQEWLP